MSRLARRAERLKLARVLGVDEQHLAFLRGIAHEDLRALRERASARLFDADEARLRRVAAASRLLPAPLIALLAEHVFGALLCARVAGLMAPERAAEVAMRLHPRFLADVSIEIDPRHVREVIPRIPVARIVEVGMELSRRGEFVTLARFVDYVSLEAIRAVIEHLGDNAALLHIAFFMEDRGRLDDIVGLLLEARMRDIIFLTADESQDLWPEALALMNEVSQDWRRRLGELAASLDESVLMSMARSAQAHQLWGAVLPIVAVMRPELQRRLANLPAMHEDGVLDAILRSTESEDLWNELLPLVPLMDAPILDRLAAAAETLGEASFGRVFEAVQAGGNWGPLLLLVLRMRESARARLQPWVRRLSPEAARGITAEAERLGLREPLSSLWNALARTR